MRDDQFHQIKKIRETVEILIASSMPVFFFIFMFLLFIFIVFAAKEGFK